MTTRIATSRPLRIHFVRHGQASAGSDDYDRLSDLGHRQARTLGQALAPSLSPDIVIHGGMRRQRETAEGFIEAWATPPERVIDASFMEFDHRAVIAAITPDGDVPAFVRRAIEKAPIGGVQAALEPAFDRWLSGTYDDDYPESYDTFRGRVLDGLRATVDNHREARDIVVVTSGGPISIIVGNALGLSPTDGLKLTPRVANCSVSRLVHVNQSLQLDTFNAYHWLEHASDQLVSFL